MLTLLVALLLAPQQTPATTVPPTTPAPATAPAAAAPVRRPPPAPATMSLEFRVTNRTGSPVIGARLMGEGPSSRDGVSDAVGSVTFRTLTPGTYRVRAEATGFISLEKEVTVHAGMTGPVEFALSRAPEIKVEAAEPPPQPPPSVVTLPSIEPGEPRIVSLLDVAENSLNGKEPVRTVPIGCSGLSRAQLLVVRDTLPLASRPDADDMLYVIAGEATITLAGKSQTISSGWFSVVPRGAARSITRRGKNPVILLSMIGGPPCRVGTP